MRRGIASRDTPAYRIDDVVLKRRIEVRIHGKADHVIGEIVGDRQTRLEPVLTVRRLPVQRNRVMNGSGNAARP